MPAPRSKLKRFTVVLLYPDYLAGDYGGDLYTAQVWAKDSQHAEKLAHRQAVDDNLCGDKVGHPAEYNEAAQSNFRMILTLVGWPRIVADATGHYHPTEEPT